MAVVAGSLIEAPIIFVPYSCTPTEISQDIIKSWLLKGYDISSRTLSEHLVSILTSALGSAGGAGGSGGWSISQTWSQITCLGIDDLGD